MSVITKIEEFTNAKPAPAQAKATPSEAPMPIETPKQPEIKAPKLSSQSQTPKMKAEDVVSAFLEALRSHGDSHINIDLQKLKKKYD